MSADGTDVAFEVPWVFGQAVTALAMLPDSAGAIADHLEALGYRGKRGGREGCPLHAYVLGKTDAVKHGVQVELDATVVEIRKGGFGLSWTLPAHLGSFIYSFDSGDFADLENDCG